MDTGISLYTSLFSPRSPRERLLPEMSLPNAAAGRERIELSSGGLESPLLPQLRPKSVDTGTASTAG